MRKLSVLFFLVLAVAGYSQNVQIQVEPRTIGIDQQATIQIQLDSRSDKIVNPEGGKDYSLQYRGMSQSRQISVVNGQVSKVINYIHTFVFTPKRVGQVTVGEFEVHIDGKVYKTKELQINVTKEAQAQGRQNEPDDIFKRFFRKESDIPVMFLRMATDRPNAKQNQQIVLDAVAFSSDKDTLYSQFVQVTPLNAPKMVVYDLTSTLGNEPVFVRNINGRDYYGRVIKRYAVYPVESGLLGLEPPIMVAVTPQGQLKLNTENIGIMSEKVQDQTGIAYMGDLRVQGSLTTNRVKVGHVVELTLEMEGDGNLKIFANPYSGTKIDGLFLSSPQTKVEYLEMRGNKAYFRQTMKYTLLAQKPGKKTIPPLEISYYNDAGQVRKAEFKGAVIGVDELSEAEEIGQRFVFKNTASFKDFDFLCRKALIKIAMLLLVLLPVAAYFYGRHQKRMAEDSHYSRKVLADSRLRKYLDTAKQNLAREEYAEFYRELQKGLFYYTTDKLGIEAGISAKKLWKELEKRGIDPKVIKLFKEIYEECNFYAFSGNQSVEGTDKVLDKARLVFEQIK